MTTSQRPGWGRITAAIAVGALLGGPVFAVAHALGLGAVAAALVAAACLGGAAVALAHRLPRRFDADARHHPIIAIAWLLAVLAGAGNLARVSVYMADPSRTDASLLPGDDFYREHNCFTAYVRAAELSRSGVENLYQPVHYRGDPEIEDDPRSTMGGFPVDLYEYPPPFLVPARAAIAASDDFALLRAGWFALETALVALALLALVAWIGGEEGSRAGLLAPAVLLSLPVVATLQIGNFQLAAYALAILAMLAFERRREALGGCLLAFVVLAKLFPAILLVDLAARRRYRAVAWTAGFGVALTGLTLVVTGLAPFRAFLGFQLPRMASGEAFPFLTAFPPAAALNHSVFGIVLKLDLLGVPGMTTQLAGWLAWAYTAVLLAVVFIVARRPPADRLEQALRWLAFIQLGALRSPFTPDVYAVFGPIWIITLLAARPGRWRAGLLAAGWVALSLVVAFLSVTRPIELGPRIALCSAGQALGIAITLAALRRAR